MNTPVRLSCIFLKLHNKMKLSSVNMKGLTGHFKDMFSLFLDHIK